MKPKTKAMKLAKQINQADSYKAKAKLVHQWHKAIIEMLGGK
jgi:hypothetical protein